MSDLGQLPVPDAYFCTLCSAFCDLDGTEVERTHTVGAMTYSFIVCPDCAETPLCTTNPYGVHSEIYDAEDAGFRPELWPGVMLDSGALYQLGQCSHCWAPMRWSVDRQRWEDLVSATDCKTLLDSLSEMQERLRAMEER